jgi:hypothetical protein
MNGLRRTSLGVVVLTLALAALSAGIRAEDKKGGGKATGTWKSTFTTNDGKTIETIYKLKQEGEKLTGTVTGRDGKEVKIEEGSVKDGKVSFQVTREREGNKFTLHYKGELSGDAIKGKLEFGDRSFNWEAKREEKAADKKSK